MANSLLQCTMLVTRLKSKYGLTVGDTVLARITAFHIVGSVTTSMSGSGTAVLPVVPCYRTTFPRIIGGTNDETMIMAMDVDPFGNIVVGGYTEDAGLLGKTVTDKVPIAVYIAKGNLFVWAKSIETNDGIANNGNYQ